MSRDQLPNCQESEMMILGSMLTNNEALMVAGSILKSTDLYLPNHQKVFTALVNLVNKSGMADVHLTSIEMKNLDTLKEVGGIQFLMLLSQYAGTGANIAEYINRVKNKALLRNIIFAANKIVVDAKKEPEEAKEFLDKIQQIFFEMGDGIDSSDSAKFLKEVLAGNEAEGIKSFIENFEEKQAYFRLHGVPCPPEGILSGFEGIDNILGGLRKQNLILIAGRPGMGKTTFALNIAQNVCFRGNMTVAVFTLEMSASQIAAKVVCSETGVEQKKIDSGTGGGEDYQRINEFIHHQKDYGFIIDDKSGISVNEIKAKIRRLKERYGVQLVVIDYLQLINGSGSKSSSESRQLEVGEISRTLKVSAREFDIPIICLSQLSRKVEERQSKKPMLSDLRDSGSLEQDADSVLFVYRPSYYDPYDMPGKSQILIAKNRHGEPATVDLATNLAISRFDSIETENSFKHTLNERF